jgi:act minimal PKS chain-length factor (CLF/KS beta)
MTGRLYAGGAALDVATALLAIRDGMIPPTTGSAGGAWSFPGNDLDLVWNTARSTRVRTAMILARGYGGFNAAVVVTAAEPATAEPATAEQEEQWPS